ncbi:iron complex transport system permease protein [Dongia mobilis]|uniref:Iron complex transport system permease protein n=1 Tax=Dongia mobilis TaxID=578943 RepID=A0A4R6WFF8_9PROT|nr:iron ABC transporter permease [Dongia mobilis]TDQ78796.1 iron complex transport system permease protein [Dongia mobilis]
MTFIDIDAPAHSGAARDRRRWRVTAILLVLAFVAALAAVATGPLAMSLRGVIAWAAGLDGSALSEIEQHLIGHVRLPRVIVAILAGAGLAISGCLMQSLFRNPLADPGLIGVSSGSALAAALAIVLMPALPVWLGGFAAFVLPVAAFVGGLVATLLILRIAHFSGGTATVVLLLAGIGISVIAEVAIGFLIFISNEQQLRDITFWRMGSLAGNGWLQSGIIAVPVIAIFAFAWSIAPALNALSLGEDVARHLGVPVQRLQRLIVIAVAAAVGTVVAFCGLIGFLGLVAPHLARLVIGHDHRWLLPVSALISVVIITFGDLVTRIAVAPAELPIGLVTGALGGPIFLYLLVRQMRGAA